MSRSDVHVWRVSLPAVRADLPRFEASLSADEKNRAARFHFERDRNCYISARGILRELLGRYLHQVPRAIQLGYSAYGKPFLAGNNSDAGMHFNVSHSHDLVLLAFSREGDIGVDVELIRPEFSGDEIAERYFSARELQELRSLPPELRVEGFFLCWTRKEAYIKARGAGLQIPLDSFSVSLTPGAPVVLQSADTTRWRLHSMEPGGDYAGAVAAEGETWKRRFYEWHG
ncbi:MAG TPA: 4'-phosphopantetheinyl transferase superfamily protein [Candidatus Acidoferrales bacterium]|nr:4'-phosphopantetheinyl transferase superfamily protein [Candidatus Acidoferrales bacterium]